MKMKQRNYKKKTLPNNVRCFIWAFLELQAAPHTAWPPKVTDRVWHPHVFLWQEKCPLHSGLKSQSQVCNLPNFLNCSFGHRAFVFLIGLEVQLCVLWEQRCSEIFQTDWTSSQCYLAITSLRIKPDDRKGWSGSVNKIPKILTLIS